MLRRKTSQGRGSPGPLLAGPEGWVHRALSCSFGDFADGSSSLTLAPTFVSSFSMVTEHLRCWAPRSGHVQPGEDRGGGGRGTTRPVRSPAGDTRDRQAGRGQAGGARQVWRDRAGGTFPARLHLPVHLVNWGFGPVLRMHPNLSAAEDLSSNMELQRERERPLHLPLEC